LYNKVNFYNLKIKNMVNDMILNFVDELLKEAGFDDDIWFEDESD